MTATSAGTPHVLYAHLGGQPALNAYCGLFTRTERVKT